MAMVKILKMFLECLRCGHKWIPRGIKPKNGEVDIRICPKCKSPYWDKPKD